MRAALFVALPPEAFELLPGGRTLVSNEDSAEASFVRAYLHLR
jgi:hypothetical protein